jgi:hypothetical protein
VASSYFVLTAGSVTDPAGGPARYGSQPATGGPWSPGLQHGGPPNALAVTVAEDALAATTGRTDLRAVRLAADFLGPVPVAELTAQPRVVRVARSAALVEVTLSSAGPGGECPCLVSRIWFVRQTDTSIVATPLDAPADVPSAGSGIDADFAYGRSLEWRFVVGGMAQPGPASVWVRAATPLLPGREMSPLARAVLVADSASGISAELSWHEWSFVNVDLDVHLVRPVIGDWLLMSATTTLGAGGAAMARSTLADPHGPLGAGLQTLVVAPLRR